MKSSIIFVFFLLTIYWNSYSVECQARTDRGKEYEARLKRFNDLTDDQKNDMKSVEKVCGKVNGDVKCTFKLGPTFEWERSNCDSFCCSQGYLIGYCKKGAYLAPNLISLDLGIKTVANCQCSNEWRDANCGSDGRFLGISCPFDSSACRRACCRSGRSGGKCGGFFKSKCKCD